MDKTTESDRPSLLARVRSAVDDLLRFVGVWTLVGSSVTALLASTAYGVWAYLQGIRGVWLYFAAGISSGAAFVLLVTLCWALVHRAIMAAKLRQGEDTVDEKGWLDHQLEQKAAMGDLLAQMKRMTATTVRIGRIVERGAAIVRFLQFLPPSWRVRPLRWVSNRTAKKVRGRTVVFAATVTEYESTAETLKTSQQAYIEWAIGQETNRDEVKVLRKNVEEFRRALSSSKKGIRGWKRALESPDIQTTSGMIKANKQLGNVLDRVLAVNNDLDDHLSGVLSLLPNHGP